MHVQRDVPPGLGPVQHDLRAVVVCQTAQLGGGHAQAGGVLDVADEDEAGAVRNRGCELADNGVVGIVWVQVHNVNPAAIAMGDVPAGRQHRAVLEVAGDDLVALFPVDAAEDDVEALRGVAGDHRLVHVGAQKAGGGAAGLLLHIAATLVDAGGGRPLLRLEGHAGLHGLGSGARRWPRPTGVHVGQVPEDRDLVSQFPYVHAVNHSDLSDVVPGVGSSNASPLASAASRRSFQASQAA